MKKLFTFCFLGFALSLVTLHAATFIDSTVVINGNTHSLKYSVPDDYNAENSYPLVIGLHYCGGTAAEFRNAIKLVTDSLEMIVACPDYSTFNGGWIPYSDANLFQIIVDSAKGDFNISLDDIYATGMSCNAEYLIHFALQGIYPFKGIFPWDPYNPNVNNYNLDSKIPIVLSFGTSDPAVSADIAIYNGLVSHDGNVNIEMVQGIGHTLSFASFGAEMVKCLQYLNDTNAISISSVADFKMDNNEENEIEVEVVNNIGGEVNVRAISSKSSVLPAPIITAVEGTDKFKLLFTPNSAKAGSALIQFEAQEKNGVGVEQITFNVTINQPAVTAISPINVNMKVKIYPNPATDVLHIEWNTSKAELSITDITGKVCIARTLENKNEWIAINALTPGLYFVSISTDKGSEIEKLVVK